MAQLDDYSGPFEPNLKLEDFSKEALAQMVRLYARLFLVIDGLWFLVAKDEFGNDRAVDLDMRAWEKMVRYQMKHMPKAMNIQGNDVAALMKIFQVDPFFANLSYDIQLINPNHGVLTVKHCPTLEVLEKEGGARIKDICGKVDPMTFAMYAKTLNPKMQMKLLKIPPRESPAQYCCRWDFSLEP